MDLSLEAATKMLSGKDSSKPLLECFEIRDILSQCILDRRFVVPDSWSSAIVLTDLGASVLTEFKKSRKAIRGNEAKLAVFLEFSCADGLLVDPATDVKSLRRAISATIRTQRILFPYILGRELHDAAALAYPQKTRLNNHESVNLLKKLPVGVFHVGYTTIGPFGLAVSETFRRLGPSQRVQGYLCAKPQCAAIHPIYLETSFETPINKLLPIFDKFVSIHHAASDNPYPRLLGDAIYLHDESWKFRESGSLMSTLSDGLNDEELRGVSDLLLRKQSQESLKSISHVLGRVIGNPSDAVASLSRPELHQMLLLFSDETIVAAIDAAVETGALKLKEYEFRTSRIARWPGPRGLRARIGPFGLQLVGRANSTNVVTSRLYELLHMLYFRSNPYEPADLAFALDVNGRVGDQDLLSEAVASLEPVRILHDLCFRDRRSAVISANFLGLSYPSNSTRDELIERALWKLGMPAGVLFKDLVRVAAHSHELRESNASGDSTETLRGHITNLFNAVEDGLQRSLEFTTWALTRDHYTANDGFTYDPAPSVDYIDFIESRSPSSEKSLALGEKNTIAPLAAGFGRLSKALKSIEPDGFSRPADQYPPSVRFGSRQFAFQSILPFLNLDTESQKACLEALSSVGRLMSGEVVVKVRNTSVHGNNVFPSTAEIDSALDCVDEWRRVAQDSGIYPTVFSLRERSFDEFGRQKIRYSSESTNILIKLPQWPLTPRLPLGRERLVIMPYAVLPAAGPLRFSVKSRPGEDPYWVDYPKRWPSSAVFSVSDLEGGMDIESDAGHEVMRTSETA